MTVAIVGSYNLGEINEATQTLSDLIPPLITQFDLALTGGFGLGAMESDLSAQLDAAVSAEVSLEIQMVNPIEGLKQALEAAIQIQASIIATLALGLPAVSADFGVQLSASAAASAAIAPKLAGIQALISGALAVKLPIMDLLGDLLGNLSVGPIVLLSFGVPTDTLSSVGSQLNTLFSSGVEGIDPGAPVFGVVLLTPEPSAWLAMQAILRTS